VVVDWWVPVALLAVVVAEVEAGSLAVQATDTAALAGLVPLVALTGRRRHEPTVVAIGVATLAAVFTLGIQADPAAQGPLAGFLALLVANFSLGLRGRSTAGAVAVGVIEGTAQLVAALNGQRPGDVVPATLFLAGAFVVGRLIRHSRDQAAADREHAQRVEAERERHAAEAAAAERSRIARELHDVIAHSLSLMVVQASVEARVQGQSGAATTTLRSVEEQGRAALVELRRLLGFLREDEAALAPLPRLADLDALLDQLRRAGHEVTSCTTGEPRDLPPGVELAAYRLIQEAVTNVAKHAPGANAHVALHYLPGEIRVAVTNGPARSAHALQLDPGAGIAGMRERVRIYGGTLTTGATADGGFEVVATIPEEAA
jgi:signal transduction histidine kinase